MKRGVAPLVLGLLAIGAVVGGYLLLTPGGHQLLSKTASTAGDIGNAVVTAVGFFVQILGTSLAIMGISFRRINTLVGFILFIFSVFGNLAIAIELIHIIAWFGEKVKNIIRP